jgi:hypothetical protein
MTSLVFITRDFALENFLRAKALMDETLQGKVEQKAKEVFGRVSSPRKAVIQLRDYDR